MNFLDRHTELIDNEISKLFTESNLLYHPFISKVYSELEAFCLRKGKRISSCSTLLAYEGFKGKIDEKILNVCAGIELYRHAILLHDDLVDEDTKRRGEKAFHLLFNYDRRFGNATTIFAGNILYTNSLSVISQSGFEKKKIEMVMNLFINEYKNVNESQTLDLLFEFEDTSLDDWNIMASKRAASLFNCTIQTGAILAGASPNECEILKKVATNIGFSFDITDDIIGTFASELEYGRPSGGDIKIGKKPLHIIYTLELLKGKEFKEFKTLLEKKNPTKDEIQWIKTKIEESGALNKAKETSLRYGKLAMQYLNTTSMNKKSKKRFSRLIDYVSESLDWYK
tara:strand:+ start:4558 stop:5580 length:1023 start_codon:yes stop_codon:yes gene_type:complete